MFSRMGGGFKTPLFWGSRAFKESWKTTVKRKKYIYFNGPVVLFSCVLGFPSDNCPIDVVCLGGRGVNAGRFYSASPLLFGQIRPTESTYPRTRQGTCHLTTPHSSLTPVWALEASSLICPNPAGLPGSYPMTTPPVKPPLQGEGT